LFPPADLPAAYPARLDFRASLSNAVRSAQFVERHSFSEKLRNRLELTLSGTALKLADSRASESAPPLASKADK